MKVNIWVARKCWKLTNFFMFSGLTIWALETIYFLIAYGWHWDAINANEKLLDKASVGIMRIGLYFFIITLSSLVNMLLKEDKENPLQ